MVLRCVHSIYLARCSTIDLDTSHHLLRSLLCNVELFSSGSRQMLLQSDRIRVQDTLADGTSLRVRLSVSSGLREASDLIHEGQISALGAGLLSGQSLHGCKVSVQATVSISDHSGLLISIVSDRRRRHLLQQLHLLRLRER